VRIQYVIRLIVDWKCHLLVEGGSVWKGVWRSGSGEEEVDERCLVVRRAKAAAGVFRGDVRFLEANNDCYFTCKVIAIKKPRSLVAITLTLG